MLGDDLPSDRSPRPVDIDRLVGPGGLDHVRAGQYQPRRHEEAGPLIAVPRHRQPDGTADELVIQPGLVHGGRPQAGSPGLGHSPPHSRVNFRLAVPVPLTRSAVRWPDSRPTSRPSSTLALRGLTFWKVVTTAWAIPSTASKISCGGEGLERHLLLARQQRRLDADLLPVGEQDGDDCGAGLHRGPPFETDWTGKSSVDKLSSNTRIPQLDESAS